MSFENTAMVREFRKIINQEKPPGFYWYAVIKSDNLEIPALHLKSIDVKSDYENGFADELIVEFVFGAGTFQYDIYPRKDNLQVVLHRRTVSGNLNDVGDETAAVVERQEMQAILLDRMSDLVSGNVRGKTSAKQGDLNDIVTVRFQLIDKATQRIRALTTGGVFRESKGIDVIEYLLTEASKSLDLDQENQILGVETIEASNQEPVKHILIPHGTPLIEMPDYIHNRCGGIYSTDFGFYLFRKTWYVYPLYDLTQFEKATRTLTILNIPPDKMPTIETTYRKTSNQVIIMATGDTVQINDADVQSHLNGNGVRFTDARKILDGFAKAENNTITALRGENTHEYLVDERKSGLNNVMVSTNAISANPYAEASKIAKRRGSFVTCVWENSDPRLITPGMAVRYLYFVGGEIQELKGSVLRVDSYVHNPGQGMLNKWHRCNSALKLFLEAKDDWTQST